MGLVFLEDAFFGGGVACFCFGGRRVVLLGKVGGGEG